MDVVVPPRDEKSVIMVCGVPGSGKSWVCEQLKDKFTYVSHDDYIGKSLVDATIAATADGKTVLIDCPFAERVLRDELIKRGVTVKPYFIVEPLTVVEARYLKRDGKALPKASATRASTIVNRAVEWGSPYGKSDVILKALRSL